MTVRQPRGREGVAATEATRPRGRIAFLIRSLEYGGAERQLVNLARLLHEAGHAVAVVTFYAGGELTAELRAAGVAVIPLGKRSRWDLARFLVRLVHALRTTGAELVHAYLGSANLLAVLVRPLLPGRRIALGVRASNLDLRQYDAVTRLVDRLGAVAARCADVVVVNSEAGRRHCHAVGYPGARLRVVPNGVDTCRFRPGAGDREALRRGWNIPSDAVVVGHVARLDPAKDHDTLLRAAQLLHQRRREVRFVCVVAGGTDAQVGFDLMVRRARLEGTVVRVAPRPDIEVLYAAFDLLCSSSTSEGFPNVVAEAMACGVPAVATDVGDCAWLIAETGLTVPARDAAALAGALERLVLDPARAARGGAARDRIVEHFSLSQLLVRTEQALHLPG